MTTNTGTGGRKVAAAAFLGMLGVILGAFGAHGLEDILVANGREEVWKTASFYHLLHAVVLLLPVVGQCRVAWWSLFLGGLIFSGSLYVLAVTNLTVLGAIAPIGGILLIVGWAWLGVSAFRQGH